MIHPSKKNQRLLKGFTLLELLIVFAVIGLLASIMLVSFSGAQKRARIAQGWKFSDSLRASLQADMVAWWTFDETSGNVARDNWFSRLNGAVYGAQWVQGIVNNALSFDGVDDYVALPDSSILNMETIDFTIEVWAKSINSTYGKGIVGKGSWSHTGYFISYAYSPADALYFGVRDSSGYKYVLLLSSARTFDWTHLVGIKTNNHLEGWVNGKKVGEWNGTIGTFTNSNPLTIGKVPTNFYFNGLIDEVRIYSAALPQSVIQQHYAEGLKRHQDLVKK